MATPTVAVAGSNNSIVDHSASNTSFASSFTSSFYENATELVSTTIKPLSNSTSAGEDVHPHLSLKDETTFVSLIVMGLIVPAIFITVIVLICRQRRKDLMARRTQMLLQNTQDFALEDYTTLDKATSPPPKI